MSTDPKLESYLSKMDRVLAPFPASDRAEIILEIKSHVLSALERDPSAQLDAILSALGEPETVANRYLMERGLRPAKPPISPFVKWLVLGGLGTFALLLVFAGIVLFRFSPLVHIDGKHDFVSLLGGSIQISGEDGTIRIGDSVIKGDTSGTSFEGSWKPEKGQTDFTLRFDNGKIDLENSDEAKLSWHCRATLDGPAPSASPEGKGMKLDLSQLRGVRCHMAIPRRLNVTLRGENGSIDVNQPRYNLDARLENGKVDLSPDDNEAYRYQLSVSRGMVEEFVSSSDPNALRLSVTLKNGKIGRS